ncbi:MAG: tetratricopeptide repeat protein [Verrucomicrobiota bacterium JB023]|nr:tetratricopeptide repeat protein [Verrucomicrobiota bacterium JB023]
MSALANHREEQPMEAQANNILPMLEDRVRSLEERGAFEEAKNVLESAVARARSTQNGENDLVGGLLLSLEMKADLCLRNGRFDEAREDYLESISLMAGRKGEEETVARLFGALAFLEETCERPDAAMQAYEKALEQLKRVRRPNPVEVVRLTNNLAFLYSAKNDFDEAETLFLKSLKLAHSELGPEDDNTTGICNNVGALYQKAGHLEQARDMHVMALEGREKSCGSHHPDTAQSHGNLAIVYAQEGNEDLAREHFEVAFMTYEELGEECREDFEAVGENFIYFLEEFGDREGAAEVRSKLKTALSRSA